MLTLSTRFIVPGVVVVLFFRCLDGLLNPVGRAKGDIKWGLVAHTVAMWSFATIYTAVNLDIQSISSIDNRGFPGDGGLFPGPLGYQLFINSKPITITPDIFIFLNGWLADGLLASSILNLVTQGLMWASPPVLSLLRYLCNELLGHRLSMPHVSRLFG